MAFSFYRPRSLPSSAVLELSILMPTMQRAAYNSSPGPYRLDVEPRDMRWTVQLDGDGMITAMPLQASRPTLAYTFCEADRAGDYPLLSFSYAS